MKDRKIKVVLVDVKKGTAESKVVADSLETYYKLLDCEAIDIAKRTIDGKEHDFIVDDNGLYNNKLVPSVINIDGKVQFVGNVIICNCDLEGIEQILSSDEVKNILNRTIELHMPQSEQQDEVNSKMVIVD